MNWTIDLRVGSRVCPSAELEPREAMFSEASKGASAQRRTPIRISPVKSASVPESSGRAG